MTPDLGEAIAEARSRKQLSLQAAAGPAKISTAYLQKLERGAVGSPSPHVLRRVAAALDLDYLQLMRLAGYLSEDEASLGPARPVIHDATGELYTRLGQARLSEDEARAVMAFIQHLVAERK